jgi:hypothetical protein
MVNTGAGGLWWIDGREPPQIAVITHLQTAKPAYHVALSSDQNWLAVARGVCGLTVYRAHQREFGLEQFAHWQEGIVTQVEFIDETHLVIIADGVPVQLRLNADGLPPSLPAPHLVSPAHRRQLSIPVHRLVWAMPNAECGDYTFEVWLDDTLLGITHETSWPLTSVLAYDATWRVVAITPTGERISSPTWEIYALQTGWSQTPLRFQARIGPENEATNHLPWAILLVGLGILLFIGGIVVWYRFRRVYV